MSPSKPLNRSPFQRKRSLADRSITSVGCTSSRLMAMAAPPLPHSRAAHTDPHKPTTEPPSRHRPHTLTAAQHTPTHTNQPPNPRHATAPTPSQPRSTHRPHTNQPPNPRHATAPTPAERLTAGPRRISRRPGPAGGKAAGAALTKPCGHALPPRLSPGIGGRRNSLVAVLRSRVNQRRQPDRQYQVSRSQPAGLSRRYR